MKMISNIVFTKNRPLQLEAYLESLRRCFPSGLVQTYILYKVELFQQEYEQVFRNYADCTVIRENDFLSDFLRFLKEADTKYVLFGVDDVVYFDFVDFALIDEMFDKYPDEVFGFSLRFGKEAIKNGNDPISEAVIAGQTVYRIDWTQGRTPTTQYPFELCATIYPTNLVKRVIGSLQNNNTVIKKLFSPNSALIKALGKVISTRSILKSLGYFYSPNTLESWNCRWCQNHSEQLPGFLYFQKQCASAIQVNMVNTSTANETDGAAEYTVEALADKYRQGYRLNTDSIAKKRPAGTHCGVEYFELIQRETISSS
ncbi:MAG: hypothetical protein ACYS83_00075 [Planctomycetota bacterium]|jgi:hypothetical protein